MATKLTVDSTQTPMVLIVTTDRHIQTVTATVGGDTGTGQIVFPVTITDSTSRVWKLVSDDKATPVSTLIYNG